MPSMNAVRLSKHTLSYMACRPIQGESDGFLVWLWNEA